MEVPELLYAVEENVAWITINREAQRNAITPRAVHLFKECLDRAEADTEVRVVAITGAGAKAFCAGADLRGAGRPEDPDAFQSYADLLKRLTGFPKPTLARVNGHCLAGGTGLMLACDIVIAADTATFGTPEVNVGLFPMMIGALIFRNAPRKKAMEMTLLGERLSAAQALGMGMVNRVVSPEQLDQEVAAVLKNLTAKSPIGLRIGKTAFHQVQDMPFDQALDLLARKIGEVAATGDAREGITAFLEKRAPQFKGK
ncbi:MAG: enoyl-CoA hydratase-related protein [Desulfobacteraceae bacterium]|nr:enoyl-CoA hydratase-related protein [Desulfobacteraceae bacterium]